MCLEIYQLVQIEAAFFAIYSLVIGSSFTISLRTGICTTSRTVIHVVCIVMYGTAASHLFLSVTYSDCVLSALLLINIILSDSLVVWRACSLWPRNWQIKVLGCALVLSTLVLTSISIQLSLCANGAEGGIFASGYPSSTDMNALKKACSNDWGSEAGVEFVDLFGSIAIALSWLTNVLATISISYKAWIHRKAMKSDNVHENSRTHVERIMLLFVESGFVYSTLWTLLVVGSVISLAVRNPTSKEANYLAAIVNLKASALIHLIGMYPTLVIIMVAYAKHPCIPTPSRGPITRSLAATSPAPRKGPRTQILDFLHSLDHGDVETTIPLSVVDISYGGEGDEGCLAQEGREKDLRKGSLTDSSTSHGLDIADV